MIRTNALNRTHMSLGQKLWNIHWLFVVLVAAVACVGFVMLYSAANGSLEPWASRQMMRFAAGVLILVAVAVTDIRFWLKWAYAMYGAALLLLGAVEVGGTIGMGAQRWIAFGFFNLQPSEVMKIALVLTLARYFHGGGIEDIRRVGFLVPPLLLVAAPFVLVLRQPDLGTALMLAMIAGIIFFIAGVSLWKFGLLVLGAAVAVPVGWQFLREYQRQRVLTFIDPDNDPLGAGYHIIQSKIALGSGGLFGRGFMQGSQSHLSFLPEKQTDFIFTMLAEEFGLVGGLGLLGLYILLLAYGFAISISSRSHFGRILGLGVTAMFFIYVFINVAMVMGLIPVVGVPLPLISYGGTSMMTLLFGFGLLMCVHVHRDLPIGRHGVGEDG